METFYNELIKNIDYTKYKEECIFFQYKLAYAAISGRIYSSKEYVQNYKELKLYPIKKIKSCNKWEKLMIKISLQGFNFIAYFFIEIRYFLGWMKRKLIV